MIWGLRRKIGGRAPPRNGWGPPRNQILATPLAKVEDSRKEKEKEEKRREEGRGEKLASLSFFFGWVEEGRCTVSFEDKTPTLMSELQKLWNWIAVMDGWVHCGGEVTDSGNRGRVYIYPHSLHPIIPEEYRAQRMAKNEGNVRMSGVVGRCLLAVLFTALTTR